MDISYVCVRENPWSESSTLNYEITDLVIQRPRYLVVSRCLSLDLRSLLS